MNAGIFNQAEIANRLLCPTFSDCFLDGSHSVSIKVHPRQIKAKGTCWTFEKYM